MTGDMSILMAATCPARILSMSFANDADASADSFIDESPIMVYVTVCCVIENCVEIVRW